MSVLATPASQELNLNDAQMGVVLGAGFAVMFALMGMPAAQLIDQRARKTMIAAGVIIWSLGTIAGAFADGYVSLTVCRASVACGEAVITPAAISLFADLFPPHKRALPMSIYASMPGLMTGGSFLLGGGALHLAGVLEPHWGLTAWRGTLVLVGLPGLILIALFILTVREPARSGSAAAKAGEGADMASFMRYLRARWRFYVPFYLGASLLVMYAYAQVAWLPSLMVRAHHLDPEHAAYILAFGMPWAVVGAFFFPWLANRLNRSGRGDGLVTAFMIAALAATPFTVFAPRASSLVVLVVGAAMSLFCMTATSTLSPLAMQAFGPSRMRARLMALSLLCSSLLGFAVGPTLVGYLSNRWQGDPMAIGRALSYLGMILGPSAAICFALCRPAARALRHEQGA